MSKREVLKEVYNEIKEWKTELNKPGKKAVLEYLANKFKDEEEKQEKKRTTYCSICIKKTPYLFCSVECKEKSQKKQISPSGLILTHDGTDYPVMIDLTDGYKLTCKEVTDDEWPDILCLLCFAAGPVNLELKVEEGEVANIKEKIAEEIITYKEMIKTAERFIEPDKVMEIKRCYDMKETVSSELHKREVRMLKEERETLKQIIKDLQEEVRELQDKNLLLKLRLEAQMEV